MNNLLAVGLIQFNIPMKERLRRIRTNDLIVLLHLYLHTTQIVVKADDLQLFMPFKIILLQKHDETDTIIT